MSAGNICMNNVNTNKYDAAQTMNAGTSSRLSMDMQQTANNENSVKAGRGIQLYEKAGIEHQGSTWIQGPNGQSYELNGTFKQTVDDWEASGTFIDIKDGNYCQNSTYNLISAI